MTTPEPENSAYPQQSEVGNFQSPNDMSQARSVNTLPFVRDYIISEDQLAGQRLHGRMSNVRRFFCLFVTFDFLFTSLLWIICVMLDGEYIIKALIEQVIHYNIHTSLFDVVLIAFCRFFMLTIFYAIFYKNHWIVILISTAGTSSFLIAKVLYFDWPHSSQPVFEVLLVLASFILAWGEAWFLDFRVIPQENYASRFVVAEDTERTPLVRSYVQGLPSTHTESMGNFYSPRSSPIDSLYRYNVGVFSSYDYQLTKLEDEQYRRLASETYREAWQVFKNSQWILHAEKQDDRVYATMNGNKKIFKLEAKMDASAERLLDDLYEKEHQVAEWNSAVKESSKIHWLDENTDIIYTISKEAAGGLISSRDFVNLRHWERVDNAYMISSCKTDHSLFPINSKYTRAENGTTCFVLEVTDDDPNKCILHWVLNIDLKLRIPNGMLDKEMIGMMFKFAYELRQHILKGNS